MLFSQIIYYVSYLSFAFLLYVIFFLFKRWINFWRKFWLFLYIFFTLLFIYSRFIEPNIIVKNEIKINAWFKAKVAVFSDIHLWVFKDKYFLERIVSKINAEKNIDFVLIPGDFTFVSWNDNDFENMFSPLKKLKVPIFVTLWNHDTSHPWPDIRNDLVSALKKNNVILLDNSSTKFKNINILWLKDDWENPDISLIKNFQKSDNLIVLAHNPDTTLNYWNNIPDITISGHTHGWQVRIPFLYKKMIPCRWDFDKWYYEDKNLFITSWAWEVWLPMRFLNFPEVVFVDFE